MSNLHVEPTDLPEVKLLIPRRFGDERGWFTETYSARSFSAALGDIVFVQDNQAFSAAAGTLRGLHFQRPPEPQAKLVRVLRGSVFDVAVDLRVGSPTFGRWVGATLTADGGEQLFVPQRLCSRLLHAGAGHRGRLQGRQILFANLRRRAGLGRSDDRD